MRPRPPDPAFTWPEGTPIRVTVEPGELAAEFEAVSLGRPAGELRAAVDRLEGKVEEDRAAREKRDRATDRFNEDLGSSLSAPLLTSL